MAKVTVDRLEPALTPIKSVTITLTAEEAKTLERYLGDDQDAPYLLDSLYYALPSQGAF